MNINDLRTEDDPIIKRWPQLLEFAGNSQELGSMCVLPRRTHLSGAIVRYCYEGLDMPRALRLLEYEYADEFWGYFWFTVNDDIEPSRKYRMDRDHWKLLSNSFAKLPK